MAAGKKDLIEIRKKVLARKSDVDLVIDIGGEGGHKEAININIGTVRGGKSIPRLIVRMERNDPLPFDDGTVNKVIMESTEISNATATEIARVIKPGGEIYLSNGYKGDVAKSEAKVYHDRVIKAIGDKAKKVDQKAKDGDLDTTITVK